MSKKIFKVLLFLSIILLISCRKAENEHSHTFNNGWEYNSTIHYHTCNGDDCGEVLDSAEHTFNEWSIICEASCDSSGAKERTCSVCGYKEQENIPSLGHSFGEWSTKTPATEESDQVQSRTCTVCGHEETKILILFDVKFVDEDGTVLEALSIENGELPIYTKETPTKTSDLTYTYEFIGWDSEIVEATEDKSYKAVYKATYINYTIVFKDNDGTEISKKDDYHYGDTVVIPTMESKTTENKFYSFDGWDNEVVAVEANATYQANYTEIDRVENGDLVWDSATIHNSIIASDFYAGLHPADLSVVQIDGKNALQVKYEEGFFDLSGTVKTTPGIQFANGNKFKLTQDSVVTFSVRVSDEWSLSNDRAGIYLFYDGEALGTINASGSLWSGATSPKVKDNVFIRKSEISVMQIFANATIGDKNWVNVAITFDGIENPDLSKLSIGYGVAQGTDYNGLLNTVDGHENSWIYISDLNVVKHIRSNEISYNEKGHWYICLDANCDAILDYEEHKFGEWSTKTPATEEVDEVQSRVCSVCNYEETKTLVSETYEITFVDYNGTTLETVSTNKGKIPVFTLDTPTREDDEDNIYLFDGWDSELVAATENKTYKAVYEQVAKTDNGQLVWNEKNINYSLIASDFYAGLHPADLSVVTIDNKNALQVKYEEGFFDLSGTVKTTPGIQFANGNKFKLTQDSVVTFSVRVSEEWSVSHNRAGIYLFYDGEACGIINATGNFWSGSTSPKVKNDVFIEKVKTSVMQIFANATIGDKNWVNVAITFNGIENPDLSKLSIAYGVAQGTDYNGLLNTVDGHKNSWIYILDLTVLGPNEITWNDATMNYYLTSNDLYAGLYPADLSVVEIDGRNALKVKYQEGFFDLPETNKTTPGITFTNTDNLQLTQSSVVTFSVRVSDEWNYSNNGGGIYIFYNGEVCGTISTSGTLWDGATATGERDRYINKSLVSVTNIFANGTIGDKNWVDVTITFEGIENPDLSNLTIAYGCMHGSNYSGLLSTEAQENSWIYISDVVVS